MKDNDKKNESVPAEVPIEDTQASVELNEPQDTTDKEATEKVKARPEKSAKRNTAEKYPAFLNSYIKAYPRNRVFYVTSDRMVFLERDRSLALLHQNSIGGGLKIETYKIDK